MLLLFSLSAVAFVCQLLPQRQETPFSSHTLFTVLQHKRSGPFNSFLYFQQVLISNLHFNMFSKLFSALLLLTLLLSSVVQATQVDKRSVGALTPLSSKSKICNVLDYGGVADNKTDIGPAIKSAFSSCVISGGATLYIPPGSYSR